MRFHRLLCGALIGWCFLAATARADAPPDPLRLVPEQADLMFKVEKPRPLIEGVLNSDIIKQLKGFDAAQELLESTNYRRFYQLVGFFEKQLDTRWPELTDKVAGGGIVVAVKLGPDPAPALIVVQSKDETALRKFVTAAKDLLEQELTRQESPDHLEKGSHREVETFRVGDKFHAAIAGSALLLSNKAEVLNLAIDKHLDGGNDTLTNKAGVIEARKMVPANTLAWAWLDLDTVHKAPQSKEIFTLPRNDANLTVLFGSYLDVIGRAPFAMATITQEKEGFTTAIKIPAGREGMPEALGMHVPLAEGDGTLPILEPKGVLYSSSFYLDLNQMWEKRDKLFNEKQSKAFDEFDKNSGKFLSGLQFSKVVGQVGTHYRLVAAEQSKTGYKKVPTTRIPGFAIVVDMRDAEAFPQTMNAALRGAALLGSTQIKTKLVEEQHGDLTLVGYRFPEEAKVPQDTADFRFNFSPCFVTVGDQFLVASTLEMGHEMVDLLQKEAKDGAKKSPSVSRSRTYGAGIADLLDKQEDRLIVQTILAQALPPNEARDQVAKFIGVVRRLGTLNDDVIFDRNEFRYQFRYQSGK
jgi:hypothetical protein